MRDYSDHRSLWDGMDTTPYLYPGAEWRHSQGAVVVLAVGADRTIVVAERFTGDWRIVEEDTPRILTCMVPVSDPFSLIEPSGLCGPPAMDAHVAHCVDCDCVLALNCDDEPIDGSRCPDDAIRCETCHDEAVIECCARNHNGRHVNPGHEVMRDDATETSGDGPVCEDCRDNYYAECDSCRTTVRQSDTYTAECGDTICDECYSSRYFTCDNCGDIYHEDQYGGNSLCDGCYADEPDNDDDGYCSSSSRE